MRIAQIFCLHIKVMAIHTVEYVLTTCHLKALTIFLPSMINPYQLGTLLAKSAPANLW